MNRQFTEETQMNMRDEEMLELTANPEKCKQK